MLGGAFPNITGTKCHSPERDNAMSKSYRLFVRIATTVAIFTLAAYLFYLLIIIAKIHSENYVATEEFIINGLIVTVCAVGAYLGIPSITLLLILGLWETKWPKSSSKKAAAVLIAFGTLGMQAQVANASPEDTTFAELSGEETMDVITKEKAEELKITVRDLAEGNLISGEVEVREEAEGWTLLLFPLICISAVFLMRSCTINRNNIGLVNHDTWALITLMGILFILLIIAYSLGIAS